MARPDRLPFSGERSDEAFSPVRLVALYLHRLRARRELAALDADQLRDVGLDPLEVRREANKPFWRS